MLNQLIKKAAVLGSGVMGSGIAAHLSKYRHSNIIIGYCATGINQRRKSKRTDISR